MLQCLRTLLTLLPAITDSHTAQQNTLGAVWNSKTKCWGVQFPALVRVEFPSLTSIYSTYKNSSHAKNKKVFDILITGPVRLHHIHNHLNMWSCWETVWSKAVSVYWSISSLICNKYNVHDQIQLLFYFLPDCTSKTYQEIIHYSNSMEHSHVPSRCPLSPGAHTKEEGKEILLLAYLRVCQCGEISWLPEIFWLLRCFQLGLIWFIL